MLGRRELLEAASYERRRVLAALLSAHREVPPARPGRTVLAGAALAALVVAAAVVAGAVAPRSAVDWTRPGLVVSRETGAMFVVLGSGPAVLHPVANATAARLVLGAPAPPAVVPEEEVMRQRIGPEVGIAGAPASLPAPSRLVDSGWTACTADGAGVRLRIARTPAARAVPAAGLVVRSDGRAYLVAPAAGPDGAPAGVRRYALPRVRGAPADNQDNLLVDLGVGIRSGSPEVSGAWLDLFPEGGSLALATFGLHRPGTSPSYADRPGVPPGARVGDVLTAPDGSLLLTADGPARLDPFALAVLRASANASGRPLGRRRLGGGPRETPVPFLPPVAQAPPPWAPAHWPDRLLAPVRGEPCAELRTAPGREPVVELATDPSPVASAAGLGAGRRSVSVAAGQGALVRSGPRGGRRWLLVDAGGTAYPLGGREAVERLGYAGHRPPAVPAGWAALLTPGVALVAGPAAPSTR